MEGAAFDQDLQVVQLESSKSKYQREGVSNLLAGYRSNAGAGHANMPAAWGE